MGEREKPVDVVVEKAFSKRQVQNMTAGWKVEPIEIINILVAHFREMGIYFVSKDREHIIYDGVVSHLKNSTEIMQKISAARRNENADRKFRHSE